MLVGASCSGRYLLMPRTAGILSFLPKAVHRKAKLVRDLQRLNGKSLTVTTGLSLCSKVPELVPPTGSQLLRVLQVSDTDANKTTTVP